MFGRKVKLPITDAHRAVLQEESGYPFTPDIYKLEKHQWQLLFVGDELMSDRHQSFVLQESVAEKATVGFTQDRFDFLIKSTDNTSVVIPNPDGNRIKGEVWVLEPKTFLKLDKLRLNGLQSLRHRVQIIDPYRETGFVQNYDGYFTPDGQILPEALQGRKQWIGPEKVWLLECWMYVGHPDYWLDMIYTNPFWFDRVQRFQPKKDKPWLDAYYKYQNPVG